MLKCNALTIVMTSMVYTYNVCTKSFMHNSELQYYYSISELLMRFCETPYDVDNLDSLVCHPFKDVWDIPEFQKYSPVFTRKTAFTLKMQEYGYDAE